MTHELAFIGGGNMAEAIVRAAITAAIVPADKIIVADPSEPRRAVFTQLGVATTTDNTDAIAAAPTVVLAVKPQIAPQLTGDLEKIDRDAQVIISIMAGLSTRKIEQLLGGRARLVRVMPNTPLLAALGMSAISLGEHAHAGDEQLAMKIFGAAGEAILIDEKHMDAVTAVSGSGPAYLFYLAEAMAQAATDLKLPPDAAQLLVRQTLVGASHLLKASDVDAAELRRRVTSPGGTTEAAIRQLDEDHVAAALREAVLAAAARSRDLGAE